MGDRSSRGLALLLGQPRVWYPLPLCCGRTRRLPAENVNTLLDLPASTIFSAP